MKFPSQFFSIVAFFRSQSRQSQAGNIPSQKYLSLKTGIFFPDMAKEKKKSRLKAKVWKFLPYKGSSLFWPLIEAEATVGCYIYQRFSMSEAIWVISIFFRKLHRLPMSMTNHFLSSTHKAFTFYRIFLVHRNNTYLTKSYR